MSARGLLNNKLNLKAAMDDKRRKTRRFLVDNPPPVMDAVQVAHDDLLASMKRCPEWDYETGCLPPLKLDKYNQALFDTFLWVEDTNDILKNIELILDDLALYCLTRNPAFYFLPGDKTTRYFLLIRTFFYEFYRIKEIFNIYLAKLKKYDVLPRCEIESAKSDFYKAFEHTFELRNKMVHRRITWGGEKHCTLITANASEHFGYYLENKETGEKIEPDDILAGLVDEWMGMLVSETESMVEVINSVVSYTTDEILKALR